MLVKIKIIQLLFSSHHHRPCHELRLHSPACQLSIIFLKVTRDQVWNKLYSKRPTATWEYKKRLTSCFFILKPWYYTELTQNKSVLWTELRKLKLKLRPISKKNLKKLRESWFELFNLASSLKRSFHDVLKKKLEEGSFSKFKKQKSKIETTFMFTKKTWFRHRSRDLCLRKLAG
jgi:hypothetical protein